MLFSRVSCQSYFSYLLFTCTLAFSRVLDFLEALEKNRNNAKKAAKKLCVSFWAVCRTYIDWVVAKPRVKGYGYVFQVDFTPRSHRPWSAVHTTNFLMASMITSLHGLASKTVGLFLLMFYCSFLSITYSYPDKSWDDESCSPSILIQVMWLHGSVCF